MRVGCIERSKIVSLQRENAARVTDVHAYPAYRDIGQGRCARIAAVGSDDSRAENQLFVGAIERGKAGNADGQAWNAIARFDDGHRVGPVVQADGSAIWAHHIVVDVSSVGWIEVNHRRLQVADDQLARARVGDDIARGVRNAREHLIDTVKTGAAAGRRQCVAGRNDQRPGRPGQRQLAITGCVGFTIHANGERLTRAKHGLSGDGRGRVIGQDRKIDGDCASGRAGIDDNKLRGDWPGTDLRGQGISGVGQCRALEIVAPGAK